MEVSAVPRAAPAGVAWQSPHLMRLASDARLVALIREGGRGAFEVAYDRHHLTILSFCRHMLADPQEAEDAVQHTFLAAYNDLISSNKPIQLKPWLFAIARNRCYSVLRARREHLSADLAETATEGLAAQVQRRQDLRDLVVDMRRLPDEQRAALVLAELDALSHEQIGDVLGVPREKVKALVFQARESLVASRTARETDCAVIRTQLANLRGGALRRGNLRRHLRECPGCRDFRRQVERQRRQLAVLLPVVPAFALKESVISAAVAGGAGTAGGVLGGAGLLAGTALKSGVMKGAIGVAVAAIGAGTIAAVGDLGLSWSSSGPPPKHRLSAAYPSSAQTGSALAQARGQSAWIAAHRTGTLVGPAATGWQLWVSPTSTHNLSLPGGGAAGFTYVSPRGSASFARGRGRRAIRISSLTPAPPQSAPSPATVGPLAPVMVAPVSVVPVIAPLGSGPATTSAPHDSGSRAGWIRVGHDGGNPSGSGTGSTPGRGPAGLTTPRSAGTATGSGSSGSQSVGGGSRPNSPSVPAPSALGGLGSTASGSGTGASGAGGGGSGSHGSGGGGGGSGSGAQGSDGGGGSGSGSNGSGGGGGGGGRGGGSDAGSHGSGGGGRSADSTSGAPSAVGQRAPDAVNNG